MKQSRSGTKTVFRLQLLTTIEIDKVHQLVLTALYNVQELMPSGDLLDFTQKYRSLLPNEILTTCHELSLGLHFLHERKIQTVQE